MRVYQPFFKNIFKKRKELLNQRNEDDIAAPIKKRRIHFIPFSKVAGKLFLIYVLVVLISGFLLCIPGVVYNGARDITDGSGTPLGQYDFRWNFLIGLFTASSAFSDTGLTIPVTAADYTFFGQLIIIILIQFGGFGVLTFKIMILVLLGRKISIKDRMLVQGERGNNSFGHTLDLIKSSFYFLIIVEVIAAILLFFNFYFSPGSTAGKFMIDNVTYHRFWASLWSGVFHSISAINNAGFDIVGNSSLMPYNTNYFLQFIFMIEFVMGGIGFPTFYDIKRKIAAWKRKEKVKFSLFTKINFISYSLVSIVGVFLVWLVEYVNLNMTTMDAFGNTVYIETILRDAPTKWNGFMNILFNTMSTRNAGFSTIDCTKLLPGSRAIMSIMMFIGSAPSSTAGGIRTTTFAIVLITIWSIMRNNNSVNAFKRKIPNETVKRALVVTIISVMLVGGTVLGISIENPTLDYLNILFVVCSAFGTTGLNTFNFLQTYGLGAFSLLLLIANMFIGQLGISSTLLVSIKGTGDKEYSYVEEDVTIG
ncbi:MULTISPECIES: TrkH family potassium uptake protein [Spiroplasma]|uniref:Potassium uptake protein KtrB n=1 Tax=Spiroplasma eriocheiris TaxID=315358 RepID=A0A0H3XL32_9MOLU|nr:potassium transporter TrkG [Spiroplasma eriocheiris]AHF58226.1 TrkH family potassium uptake protein,transmembrane component [Spiroplasma eriocheiris CCTCC M 207170]AKM54661.1 potassium uptake protein KtrB [Spiroplasma eriocheiris]